MGVDKARGLGINVVGLMGSNGPGYSSRKEDVAKETVLPCFEELVEVLDEELELLLMLCLELVSDG